MDAMAFRTVHPWTRQAYRRMVWYMVVCIAVPLLAVAALVVGASATGNRSLYAWSGIAGLSGLSGFGYLLFVAPGRRTIIRHRGRVCGNCLFELEGLGDTGVCPECAHPFEIETTIRGWERDLHVMHLGTDFGAASKRA